MGDTFFMFEIMPVLFGIFFVVFITVIGVQLSRGMSRWRSNNSSPVLTVEAKIATKRMAIHGNSRLNSTEVHSMSSSRYFITFEFASGDRLELNVPDTEYGLLAEGDTGVLTFQGTRYRGFQRNDGDI